jgi:hypothetical protein
MMNEVLRSYLRRFVLAFFDDILIYNSSWSEHLQHVCHVLAALQENQLFKKHTKCTFGRTEVSYLGHVISAVGVVMDQQKMQAVPDWKIPSAVRAFLGLAGYYHQFIRDYGAILAPHTKLLRKGGFTWGPEAEDTFHALQRARTTAPVLQLPNIDKSFIVECDASGSGFDVVLHQGTGSVAFFSR